MPNTKRVPHISHTSYISNIQHLSFSLSRPPPPPYE